MLGCWDGALTAPISHGPPERVTGKCDLRDGHCAEGSSNCSPTQYCAATFDRESIRRAERPREAKTIGSLNIAVTKLIGRALIY
jgi:hypothetical protein